MEYYCVDRLEDGLAVLLDDEENTLKVPAGALAAQNPPVREGDILVRDGERWVRDDAETERRRARAAALLARVLARRAAKEGLADR